MSSFSVNRALLQASRVVAHPHPAHLSGLSLTPLTSPSLPSSEPTTPASITTSTAPSSRATSPAPGPDRRRTPSTAASTSRGAFGSSPTTAARRKSTGSVARAVPRSRALAVGQAPRGSFSHSGLAEGGRRDSCTVPTSTARPADEDLVTLRQHRASSPGPGLSQHRRGRPSLAALQPLHPLNPDAAVVPIPLSVLRNDLRLPARPDTADESAVDLDDELDVDLPPLPQVEATTKMGPVDTRPRVEKVRELMKAPEANVDVYIVPTEDAHGSEYITDADARREYVTGFTGSAGTALLLSDAISAIAPTPPADKTDDATGASSQKKDHLDGASLLFTDGRYFNQAASELDSRAWALMKQGVEGVPTWQEYLVSLAKKVHVKNAAASPASAASSPRLPSSPSSPSRSPRSLPPGLRGLIHEDPAEAAKRKAPKGLKVGIDPTLISAAEADRLARGLKPYDGRVVPIEQNLVDGAWAKDRPTRQHEPIVRMADRIAGKSATEKVAELRKEMVKRFPVESSGNGNGEGAKDKESKVAGVVVTQLDEVAWLLNLRGNDIAYNPVFFSYAYVPTSPSARPQVFLASHSLDASRGIVDYLKEADVEVKPYADVWQTLAAVGERARKEGKKVVVSNRASMAVAKAVNGGLISLPQTNGNGNGNAEATTEVIRSPVADLKAIKNPTEIEGFRRSHVRDGAALVSYFAWLDRHLSSQAGDLTEYAAAEELDRRRARFGGQAYKGMSFPTISATGSHAAIIHYGPAKEGSKVIDKDEVYLCDSGGQYEDGTTDVTRTMHFGTPTPEQKRAFTRVLQGHIAIDTAVFPKGTTGLILDAFARRALWQDGLDYRHGTGHGVGHFCNVHEGPQGIGTKIAYNEVAMKEGMTISNEPGYYEDGSFGIRTESVLVVTKASTPNNFGDRGYLAFENFTQCPIQTKMVERDLLSTQERTWLNRYHDEVLSKLSPLLEHDDPEAFEWLKKECSAI